MVTVCLNAEKHIAHQLKTVSDQSWYDVEHIVIDGGSTDDTIAIVQAAADSKPSLRWISGIDNGIGDAMNKGLALATGEIIAFLHADDFYADNEVLARVTEFFTLQPQAEWLTGGIKHVDDSGRILKSFPARRWSYQRLLRGNILFHPATFVRKRVLESVGGFDASLNFTMDYDLWLRLGKRTAPYKFNQPLACFRIHPESTSVKNVDAAFKEEFKVRCRYLHGKPIQKALHQLYFYLKFFPNRLSIKHSDVR